MPIEHITRGAGAEAAAELLARDGCVVVDRALPAERLARVREELAPWHEAVATGIDDFSGLSTRRSGALLARSETAREIVMDSLVLATTKRVLKGATSFHLHLTQVIEIGPGEPGQPIHRDQWAFDFFPFPKGYEVQVNTLWAVSEFVERNGATRVVPGSHVFEDKLKLKQADSVPAEMEPGSVLLYTGALYHGGGANHSDAARYAINVTYARSWLRQEENQYLSVPLDIAKTLPEDLLRLMGYQRGAYALGYVDDLRDPMDVVRPDAASQGFGDPGSSLRRAQEQLRED